MPRIYAIPMVIIKLVIMTTMTLGCKAMIEKELKAVINHRRIIKQALVAILERQVISNG